jgi:hypothetical protein
VHEYTHHRFLLKSFQHFFLLIIYYFKNKCRVLERERDSCHIVLLLSKKYIQLPHPTIQLPWISTCFVWNVKTTRNIWRIINFEGFSKLPAANWPSVDSKNKRLFRHLPVKNENVKIKKLWGKKENRQNINPSTTKIAECDPYCSLVYRYNFSIILTVRFSIEDSRS